MLIEKINDWEHDEIYKSPDQSIEMTRFHFLRNNLTGHLK
jgi:hypothetical protein